MKEPFKKDNVQQKYFLQSLGLLIMKNNLPLQFVESIWFKCLILHLFPRVLLYYRKHFFQEILLNLVEKMKQLYILPKLTICISAIARFDLRMSKGALDIFTLL
jgi:hypothetical protein